MTSPCSMPRRSRSANSMARTEQEEPHCSSVSPRSPASASFPMNGGAGESTSEDEKEEGEEGKTSWRRRRRRKERRRRAAAAAAATAKVSASPLFALSLSGIWEEEGKGSAMRQRCIMICLQSTVVGDLVEKILKDRKDKVRTRYHKRMRARGGRNRGEDEQTGKGREERRRRRVRVLMDGIRDLQCGAGGEDVSHSHSLPDV